MTFYADLSSCDYFGAEYPMLVAVGWLEPGHAYARGSVTDAFVDRLAELLERPWAPKHFFGPHACGFCTTTGRTHYASQNLFVPASACVYVAPSMILHYIKAHQYAPPVEFQDAVAACPNTSSPEYVARLRAHHVYP